MNLPGWLRKAKPQESGDLFLKDSDEVWPQTNETHEVALRNALKSCDGKPAPWTIAKLKELEDFHSKRRNWVWAEVGLAPMALALKHLMVIADICAKPVSGGALDDLVAGYTSTDWITDAAALDAMG